MNAVLKTLLLTLPFAFSASIAEAQQLTFTPPVNIAAAPPGRSPAVAVDRQDNINVMYLGGQGILFTHSTDLGKTWAAPTVIAPSGSFNNLRPSVIDTDAAGNIYVVWEGSPRGTIFFARSTDHGATFAAQAVGAGGEPFLKVQPTGQVHIVWTGNGIEYVTSADGATFSSPQVVGSGASQGARMVVDGVTGTIDVVWDRPTVMVARSTNGGQSFFPPADVSRGVLGFLFFRGTGIKLGPQGDVNVIWQENVNGVPYVFFSRSVDGGATFSLPVNATLNGHFNGNTNSASVGVDPADRVFIVYECLTRQFPAPVCFTTSADGITFTAEQPVPNAFSGGCFEWLVDTFGNIFSSFNAFNEIRFTYSSDGAATFSPPQTLFTGGRESKLARDSGGISVLWEGNDPTTGTPGVFLARAVVPRPIQVALQQLAAAIKALPIPDGVKRSLLAKVEGALASFERGQIKAAIRQLEAFIHKIQALAGKHIVSHAQADDLTARAEAIITALTPDITPSAGDKNDEDEESRLARDSDD